MIFIGRRWWVVSAGFISYPRYCHRSATDLLILRGRANPDVEYRMVRGWTNRTPEKAADGLLRRKRAQP